MNSGRVAINRFLIVLACAVALLFPQPGEAARRDKVLESQLRAHIETLASDEFEGREPGTEGEARTLRYLGKQWFDMGLVSGTNNPGSEWFAPVTLVAREPAVSVAQFNRRNQKVALAGSESLMITSGKRSLVRDAPVLFAGLGAGPPPGRHELAGRVVMLLDVANDNGERQDGLLKAGASAVITVLDGERTLESVAARRQRSGYALASDALGGDLEGFLTPEAVDRVLHGTGLTLASLKAEAAGAAFKPRLLPVNATLEATTRETTIRSHNLIGKIPGRRSDSGAVLFLSHWDHFGVCAEVPAEDLICNGAIDNASGVASLTEIARRLLRGPQPDRDIYFLATTAEELGLLGAHAFAENPPIPLSGIVAAFNIDSNALAPAGTPFGIVGEGMTALDSQIEAAARKARRKIVKGGRANDYVRRQDGWALLQHDIPAVLVSTAYGDVARVERFFDGVYHRPSDGLDGMLELGGAADDVNFLVELGRWFADLKKVPPPAK